MTGESRTFRCLTDPHYISPPTYGFHPATEGDNRQFGWVNCGWGEVFAIVWATLFRSETWLTEVLKPRFEEYASNLPLDIWSFRIMLRETGPVFDVEPGNACDAGAYPDYADDTDQRFNSHNVDSLAQTLALFTLASIWFSAVADIVRYIESLEQAEQYRYDAKPLHKQSEIWWHFKVSSEHYRGYLYRIRVTELPSKEYFIFSQSEFDAKDNAETQLGNQLFDYEILSVEEVAGNEFEQLPLLVPVPNTAPNNDEEDET